MSRSVLPTFLLGALLVSSVSLGEEQPEAPAPPAEVTVGVYVNQIHEFKLKEKSFTADFYVWLRWKDPELKPYETFSVVDGRIASKSEPVVKELEGGYQHAYTRVVASITRFYDVHAFPFDNHQLPIVIEEEDGESFVVRYLADKENSGSSPSMRVPGWTFQGMTVDSAEQSYRSNFGDTSLPTGNESRYARLTASLSLAREGGTYFLKLFSGMFACVMSAMLAFFIRPTNVDPRFGVGVGALFGSIASQYVVAGALPESNLMTLADMLHLTAYIFIIASVAQSTASLWLWEKDQVRASRNLDRVSGCSTRWPTH